MAVRPCARSTSAEAPAGAQPEPLKARGALPTREEIREHLSGNYCRCTGYQAIVDAVESVAQDRLGGVK